MKKVPSKTQAHKNVDYAPPISAYWKKQEIKKKINLILKTKLILIIKKNMHQKFCTRRFLN